MAPRVGTLVSQNHKKSKWTHAGRQGLSQELETGCLKLAIVKFLGVQIFKGDHNILRFQPYTCINSSK